MNAATGSAALIGWTVAALAIAALALAVAVLAFVRLRALEGRLGQSGQTRRPQQPQATRLEALEAQVGDLASDLGQALRHVAVVRYDAFGDMGGQMSFSAAIIDDAGDGLVISSIHARGESRTYAKGLVAGASEVVLSPEERQALDAARTGRAD